MMIDELTANAIVVENYDLYAVVAHVISDMVYTVQSLAFEITNELAAESCFAAVFTSSSTLCSQV